MPERNSATRITTKNPGCHLQHIDQSQGRCRDLSGRRVLFYPETKFFFRPEGDTSKSINFKGPFIFTHWRLYIRWRSKLLTMAKDDEKCLLSDCTFIHLPKYADFILTHHLDYFVRRVVEYSFEVDLPLLRHLASVSRDDLVTLSMTSNRALLEALATNDIARYIDYAKENWLANMLPVITREQILSDDITLVSHIRRTVFLEMLAEYSTDPNEWSLIMKEADKFTVMMDSTLLNTYLLLKLKHIEEVGRALKGHETQWLETQSIGKIGSFEWDIIASESHNGPRCLAIFENADVETDPLEPLLDYVHDDD